MEDFSDFNPEIEISPSEAGELAAVMAHPGFKVIQKISRCCVDMFVKDWINQDTEEKILKAHKYAKVAAMLYTMQLNNMTMVVDTYVHSKPSSKPIDVAEALDIGEYSHEGDQTEEEPFSI